jgi:hypothetical protein
VTLPVRTRLYLGDALASTVQGTAGGRRIEMAEISGVILLIIGLFVSPIVGMWFMAFLV